MGIYEQIIELELKIRELPTGTLTYKTINGKKQPYLQWTENGKSRSRYVRKAEREVIFAQLEQRNELQLELKELKAQLHEMSRRHLLADVPGYRVRNIVLQENQAEYRVQKAAEPAFWTNVVRGRGLTAMAWSVKNWKKRDCYDTLSQFLHNDGFDRVCLIYGLRRTGKTTLLRQAMADMTPEELDRTVYIKIKSTDTMDLVNQDLKRLFDQGYEYVFIDEVTLMPDFISSAALFSDVYAAQGMKIVLSGTDSLGFWFALDEELYDRAVTIHTTFIPFREHSKVLGIESIDEYIRYGGTLRAGELNFDDQDVNVRDASFRDDESARRYIDTAICKNIQHSLNCYRDGSHFRHLYDLYEAGELTGAINRIIEDMNHRFVVSVLTSAFKSHDLGSAAEVLRKERDPEQRTDLLDRIDRQAVTDRLMQILNIKNKEEQAIGITKAHVTEIKEYLHALELIENCPVETVQPGTDALEQVLFTQPGMRYCQAQALVFSLEKDELFISESEYEKRLVSERILEEVRGRMMEEIVLLETMKARKPYQRVFKLLFAAGEYDMVIYNSRDNTCECYEIKHSDQIVGQQMRYLLDEEKLALTERRFGKVVKRCVLYRGADAVLENGIEYRNVEEYLKGLE